MIIRALLISVLHFVVITQATASTSSQPHPGASPSQDQTQIREKIFDPDDPVDSALRAARDARLAALKSQTISQWAAMRELNLPGEYNLHEAQIIWNHMGAPLDYRWIWVKNGIELDLSSVIVTNKHSTFWISGYVKDDSESYVRRYRAMRIYCSDRALAYGHTIPENGNRKAPILFTDADFGKPKLPDLDTSGIPSGLGLQGITGMLYIEHNMNRPKRVRKWWKVHFHKRH